MWALSYLLWLVFKVQKMEGLNLLEGPSVEFAAGTCKLQVVITSGGKSLKWDDREMKFISQMRSITTGS